MKNLSDYAPDMKIMLPFYQMVNDIINGSKAIKKGTTTYLPKFPAEELADYTFRLQVAKFTNIYRDVLEGLATKPFQSKVTILGNDVPEEITEFVKDVDGSGNNLTVFSALTFFNGINCGIDWILIDFPVVPNAGSLTLADAKLLNLKPYWSHISAINVLEVKIEMVGSKETLSYFRFKEPSIEEETYKIREFILNGDVVEWYLYEEKEINKEMVYEVVENGIMSIDLIPVVPFVTGRREGKSFVLHPPMLDAADLQIKLYQNESALEYIKNLACYPMLTTSGKPVKGEDDKPVKVAIGPNKVLYGAPTDNGSGADWRYVEPNANSLEFLQKNIDKTKNDLRELGRQPLTALSTQLTTVTTSIAAGKAKSAVTAWAYGLSDTLENAMYITCKWMGIDYSPEVFVFTGFDDIFQDSSDIVELGKARERGDISLETLWSELKRRKILSPEFDAEVEKQRLLADIPSSGPDIQNEETNNINQDEGINNDVEN